MKILYDLIATQPTSGKYHGGGTYAKTIFQRALDKGIVNFDCVYNPDRHMDSSIVKVCNEYGIKLLKVSNNNELKELILRDNYERFYSALPYGFTDFNFKKTEFIFTIHGLRPLEVPFDSSEIFFVNGLHRKIRFILKRILYGKKEIRSRENEFRKLLELENKKIIVVSNHTKYSIYSFFSDIQDDIVVLNSPIGFEKNNDSIPFAFENYFLLVSGNRWIKNNLRAIKALDNLFTKGLIADKKVIILGVGDARFNKLVKNKDRFIFLDYVEDQELELFFKNAFCFIYPTLNEGFGYPPIQAMKYGVPVIASAASAVPEVCLDAVSYINPYSERELQNRILQVTMDESYYKLLVEKGKYRVAALENQQEIDIEKLLKIIFK